MSISEKVENPGASNVLYLGVSGENFTQKVKEGTPGAKHRTYTNDKNETFNIYEVIHKNLRGFISELKVFTNKFQKEQLLITLTNGTEIAKIYISVKTGYFTSFCKRLPNIELDKEVIFPKPYDFVAPNNKRLIGLTIMQDGSKVNDHYWDRTEKKYVGLPELPKPYKEMTSAEREIYYATQRQYFIESVALLAKGIPEINKLKAIPQSSDEDITFEQKGSGEDFFDDAADASQPKI